MGEETREIEETGQDMQESGRCCMSKGRELGERKDCIGEGTTI